MHRYALLVFLVLIGVLFLVVWGAVFIPPGAPVASCGTINASGVYDVLPPVLIGATETTPNGPACIVIGASNVVLNCSGKIIQNNDTPLAAGIAVKPFMNNVTIKNCFINGYNNGIRMLSNLSFIQNNTIDGQNKSDSIGILMKAGNNTISNNTIFNLSQGGTGIYLSDNASYNTVTNNFVNDSENGYYVATNTSLTNNNRLMNNNASYCKNGFSVEGLNDASTGPRFTTLLNNSVENTGNPFILKNSNNNNFTNNIEGNGVFGFQIEGAGSNIINSNIAHDNFLAGFAIIPGSYNNTIINNIAYGNNPNDNVLVFNESGQPNPMLRNESPPDALPLGGFLFFADGGSNNITNNTAYHNKQNGIELIASPNNNLSNNRIYSNLINGLAIIQSDNIRLINNTVFDQVNDNCTDGNTEYGVWIADSNNTFMHLNRYYNNTCLMFDGENLTSPNEDFFITNDKLGYAATFSIVGDTFTNPNGTQQNYTILNLVDSLEPGQSTAISWFNESFFEWAIGQGMIQYPPDRASFEGKAVSLRAKSNIGVPTNNITNVMWLWNDNEVNKSPNYNESTFQIWEFYINSSGKPDFQNIGAVLNTTANYLSVNNLNTHSLFFILYKAPAPAYKNVSSCVIINESGSFQLNQNLFNSSVGAPEVMPGALACIKIAAPNVNLDCSGYNITNLETPVLPGPPGVPGIPVTTIGILVNGSASNVTVLNCPGISGYIKGVHSFMSALNSFANIKSFNNSEGFHIQQSMGNVLSGVYAYGNGFAGIHVYMSNNTILNSPVLYNNSRDLLLEKYSTGGQMLITMNGALFLNPAGTLENYTNLSLSDDLNGPGDEVYTINWTSDSIGEPDGLHKSFMKKYIDISHGLGSVPNITSAVWSWTDAESSGFNESAFQLWEYNATGWTNVSETPNTVLNQLSLSNFNPHSTYGIFYQIECLNDKNCDPSKPVCNLATFTCGPCSNDTICQTNYVETYPYCSGGSCVECSTYSQCSPFGQLCTGNNCTQCSNGSECQANYGTGSVCLVDGINLCGNCTKDTAGDALCASQYPTLPRCGPNDKCVACVDNTDCTLPTAPNCNGATNTCGPCTSNDNCTRFGSGWACSAGTCVAPQCSSDYPTNCNVSKPACENFLCQKCGFGNQTPDYYCQNYFYNATSHIGTPICIAQNHSCVQCTDSSQCLEFFPGMRACTNTNICVPCLNDSHCTESKPYCKQGTTSLTNACVESLSSTNSTQPTAAKCTNNLCSKCTVNTDCSKFTEPFLPVCNATSGSCGAPECQVDNDCANRGSNWYCFSYQCVYRPPFTGGSSGGGCTPKNYDLNFDAGCENNTLTLYASNKPIPDITVTVNFDSGSAVSGKTDSNGKFSFKSQGSSVIIYVNRYSSGSVCYSTPSPGYFTETLKSLSECGKPPECRKDGDCPTGKICKNERCVAKEVQPPPPTKPPECLGDKDCPNDRFCTGGTCQPVTGKCGYAFNHTFVAYECCENVPCSSGFECKDNACSRLQYDIVNITGGFVGDTGSALGLESGKPFIGELKVTNPDGSWKIITTTNGNIEVDLTEPGDYKIDLFVDGVIVKSAIVTALPKPPAIPGERPVIIDVIASPTFWIIFFVIIGAVGYLVFTYLFGGKKTKK